MRYLIFAIISSMIASAEIPGKTESDVTSKVEESTSPGGIYIKNVTFYRKKKRVLTRIIIRKPGASSKEEIQEVFFAGDSYVYTCSRNPSGETFYSTKDIDVCIKHGDADGNPDAIIIAQHDKSLIDWFERDSDGFFVPVQAERLAEADKLLTSVYNGDFTLLLQKEHKHE